MYRLGQLRILIVATAFLLLSLSVAAKNSGQRFSQTTPARSSGQTEAGDTTVRLQWAARLFVTRYRLQIARDVAFADIVFDGVVAGNEYRTSDLPPGRYFWRIAPLTGRLGEFSAATAIEVHAPTVSEKAGAQKTATSTKASVANQPNEGSIVGVGGWRAAVGEVNNPVLAHLRSRDRLDLVGVNSEGLTFALDSSTGVALWSVRKQASAGTTKVVGGPVAPILIGGASGLDNVVVLSGTSVTSYEGSTGRELWRATLPAAASAGTVIGESRNPRIFVVDNSRQRGFIIDGSDGGIVSEIRLSDRIVGAPVSLVERGSRQILLAYANGHIEVRNETGAIVRSGDAGSQATTAPLLVRSPRGTLVIVGTKSGLTALNADDLRALGRVVIKDDAPRGTLAAGDLNGDGAVEVIMITERGRVVTVNAADGKILWDAGIASDAERVAFADVNGDGVLDVLVSTAQTFALALSGGDGSIVWKDNEAADLVANHAAPVARRSVITLPFGRGALIIAGDSSRTGLRAIELPKGSLRTGKQ